MAIRSVATKGTSKPSAGICRVKEDIRLNVSEHDMLEQLQTVQICSAATRLTTINTTATAQ